MRKQKVLSTMLTMSMLMSMCVTSHAAEYSTHVGVTGGPAQISVTVPISLNAKAGVATTHDLTFENTGKLAVTLKGISVRDSENWSLHDNVVDTLEEDRFSRLTQVIDTYQYDIEFFDSSLAYSKGYIDANTPMNAKESTTISCNVGVAPISSEIKDVSDLCSIDYTFDWFSPNM